MARQCGSIQEHCGCIVLEEYLSSFCPRISSVCSQSSTTDAEHRDIGGNNGKAAVMLQ
jgi:hypothetical protein